MGFLISSRPTLRFWLGLLVFAGLLFFRAPNILLHAQFWGEDGWNWYPEAYHLGLSSLFLPHTGYFQTISRLIALVGAPFPLAWNPTIYAGFAFIFQLLPAAFLFSDRGASLCPSRAVRFLLGCLFCLAPNTTEVFVNLTNSQWHLAVLAFLIIVSEPPETTAGRIFDYCFLAISALSGPFCLLLFPVAAFRAATDRRPAPLIRLAILTLGVAIQAIPLIETSGSTRLDTPLGARPFTLIRLLAAQLFLVPLIGHHHLNALYANRIWLNPLFPCVVDLIAGLVCLEAARRWPAMRYALLFIILVLAAALSHPVVSTTIPQWDVMFIPDTGMRYFFMPTLFWMAALTAVTFSGRGLLRVFATVGLLAVLLFGVPHDRRIYVETDRGFGAAARAFDNAPPGTSVTVPVRPNSSVTLIR
ncbi:hypothetical protein [Gluconobacter kanchanaburiensis]|uniref:DUF2029 domain-containing protein n=1 Tax=Gluconobacter kanchanaburiensis NBRC 103587 TaxID=1307948 RepID=A0A511B3W7_9PROT|nr:hypothetical protein [Gluconobacter kanchanaburiensis]MBF0860687.1 hypothetical protein [Gluconobacter kanchanaburiensis]GBR69610.1 glucosyltransferase [Gluconobacter kanchanaburiensis NBRC 103587]GEK95136.1 hypothetical protein GKA01_03330 [Gluconobacter kanchanaburiensis NBRC 103587]